MSNGKWKQLLLVTTASAITIGAAAQAPPPGALPPGAQGMTGPVDHLSTIQRLGLGDPALKLSARQRAEIDNIIGVYVAEQQTLAAKQPITPGTRPSEESIAARRAAFDQLSLAVGNVLNSEQRGLWQNAQAQRQAQLDAAINRARAQARSR